MSARTNADCGYVSFTSCVSTSPTLVAALIIAAPLAASAQIAPSYAQPANGGEAQIRGRILDFDGGYSVHVRDEKGYVDAVRLHQGTIINPTGLTLAPGMVVSILGYNAGDVFAANEIDTPYQFTSGYAYYGGHPWNYYGPSVSLGFFFGNAGWWHGNAFIGGPSYVGGVRYYNNVHVNAFYHGGSFAGRNYVAPPQYGGYHPGHFGPQGYGYHAPGGPGGYRAPQGGERAPQAGSYHGGGEHGGGAGGFHGEHGGGEHGGGEHGGGEHR